MGGEEERGVAMRLEDSYLQNIAYLKCQRVVILLTTAPTVFLSTGMRSTVRDLWLIPGAQMKAKADGLFPVRDKMECL